MSAEDYWAGTAERWFDQLWHSILNATPHIPIFVDRILKGAKPADMPIEVITRRELIINLKTAKQIGVPIPSELIKRADRVIE